MLSGPADVLSLISAIVLLTDVMFMSSKFKIVALKKRELNRVEFFTWLIKVGYF